MGLAGFFFLSWMWSTHELPFVDVGGIPEAHVVKIGGKRVGLRRWLRWVERGLDGGEGDGRLSRGEFLLARELPGFKPMRLWETFGAFAAFVRRSRAAGRCRARKQAGCEGWPKWPKYAGTMKGITRARKHRPRYRYSRHARLCRAMARMRSTQRVTSQQVRRTQRLVKRHKHRMLALLKWVKTLPKFKTRSQWLRYLRRQWRDRRFRKKLHGLLGFQPSRSQIALVFRLVRGWKRGKRPGAMDVMRLTRLALRSPLARDLLPTLLAGWLIWGGDQRGRRVKWADWKAFLKRAPLSCSSSQRRLLSRSFFCGTTLKGAEILLSKSIFLNHFARSIVKPFGGTTFDESLRRCLVRRIGLWMTHGYGKRCLSRARKERFFRLLVRTSIQRYEPYTPARSAALQALISWRPRRAMSCVIRALHPRREPSSYIRVRAVLGLVGLVKRHPQTRQVVLKYLRHLAFGARPGARLHARWALLRLADRQALDLLPGLLRVKPLRCVVGQGWGMPTGFWSVMVDQARLRKRSLATRRLLYRAVQCGEAPFPYVQGMMRYLQPRHEPNEALRLELWKALLVRYLAMYRYWLEDAYAGLRSRRRFKWRYRSAQWHRRKLSASRGSRRLLVRALLAYLRQVGLQKSEETSAKVRRFALFAAAALELPASYALLRKRRLTSKVLHALARRVRLELFTSRLLFHGYPKVRFAFFHPTKRRFASFSTAQKTALRKWWSSRLLRHPLARKDPRLLAYLRQAMTALK